MCGFSIAFFATLFISLVPHGYGIEQRVISEEEDLEIERQLKIINKPALKTIQTEYGDIIDCVDIYKQPALDHPLLKNHKIQRRPRSALPVAKKEVPSLAKPVTVSEINGCPSGSVPIRRTTKVEFVRSKFSNPANMDAPPADRPNSHFSVVSLKKIPGTAFNGARAYIDTYNPKVEDSQSSAAQIWIEEGPTDQVNSIQVGWVVDPGVYGDNLTHLFTYWTGDGYKSTGCYDLRCPGFVQVDNVITLGAALSRTSTIDGDIFVILAYVYQDQKTGHWWFVCSEREIHVGYWPKQLFSHLTAGATTIAYGGRAQGLFNQLSPPMGSGLKPDTFYRHSCFFAHVEIVNDYNQLDEPTEYGTKGTNDKSGCYGLDNHGWDGKDMGYVIMFGGPGGHCGN